MKFSAPFIATIMAASANTTYASGKAGKSGDGYSGAGDDVDPATCNLVRAGLGRLMAEIAAVNVVAYANDGLPTDEEGKPMRPKFANEDVVVNINNLWTIQALGLEGILAPDGAGDIYTYGDFQWAYLFYLQQDGCEKIREMFMAYIDFGVDLATIGFEPMFPHGVFAPTN